MQVEIKSHPRGEAGTRVSIEEAAQRAAAARIDPRVRAWSIEKIVQAGNPPAIIDRAKALLDALRKERIYVEDPTDAEFMPSAACTLVGCQGLKFLGEDCDGLLIAWLGACGSIGIFGAVVGHSYNPTGQLSHVLGAVWDGSSRWYKGDPSTKQVFGTVSKPTRERWVAVHDGRLLCDKLNGCDPTKVEAPMTSMRPAAEFIGVVGSPLMGAGTVGDPPPAPNVNLIIGTPEDQAVMRKQIADGQDRLRNAMYESIFQHEKLVAMREYFNRPIVDMDIVQNPSIQQDAGAAPDEIWSQTDEANYQNVMKTSSLVYRYGEEAVTGRRPVARRTDNTEIVILGTPNEELVSSQNGEVIVAKIDDPSAVKPRGTLGLPQAVVIAIVIGAAVWVAVVMYGVYTVIHEAIGAYNQTLQTLQLQEMTKFYNSRIAAGDTPEQASHAVDVVVGGVTKIAKSNADAETASPMNKFLQTAETVAWAALGIGVIVAAGYAIVQVAPLLKARRALTA